LLAAVKKGRTAEQHCAGRKFPEGELLIDPRSRGSIACRCAEPRQYCGFVDIRPLSKLADRMPAKAKGRRPEPAHSAASTCVLALDPRLLELRLPETNPFLRRHHGQDRLGNLAKPFVGCVVGGLILGDSIRQLVSQALENMSCNCYTV
jgi:hypothetical protein